MPNPTGTPNTGRPAATDAAAGRWVLDPAHSSVRIASKTMWGLVTVKGGFADVTGEGEVLPGGAARGSLTVRAASIDTGNAKRDTHLRSAEFFGADEHPDLVFTARSVAPSGNGTAEVTGELTVRGVSRPVAFAARLTVSSAQDVTLEAETALDRAEFGMTWNQLGMIKGATTVTIAARFRHEG